MTHQEEQKFLNELEKSSGPPRQAAYSDVAREMGIGCVTEKLLCKEIFQKVDLNTIEKTCLLFGCGVGDFLEIQISNQSKNISL